MKLVPTEQGYLEWSGEMILQLQATADRRLELLREIYEYDGAGLSGYMLNKIEDELGEDYFKEIE